MRVTSAPAARAAPAANPARSRRPWPGFPWTFFAVVLAASLPWWVLGGLTSAWLMPGLPPAALMFSSTALVAGLHAYRTGGRQAVLTLLARTVDVGRPGAARWHLLAALLMPGVLVASWLVMRAWGMPLPEAPVPWSLAPGLLLVFLVAAAGEELAWSATVLEPLRSRTGALEAALIIGVVGALWHVVPLAQAHRSAGWILGQCLFTVAFRVVLAWLYARAGRSVLAAVLGHASYNVAWQLFPDRGSGYDPWIAAGITALVATAVTLGWRSRRGPDSR